MDGLPGKSQAGTKEQWEALPQVKGLREGGISQDISLTGIEVGMPVGEGEKAVSKCEFLAGFRRGSGTRAPLHSTEQTKLRPGPARGGGSSTENWSRQKHKAGPLCQSHSPYQTGLSGQTIEKARGGQERWLQVTFYAMKAQERHNLVDQTGLCGHLATAVSLLIC